MDFSVSSVDVQALKKMFAIGFAEKASELPARFLLKLTPRANVKKNLTYKAISDRLGLASSSNLRFRPLGPKSFSKSYWMILDLNIPSVDYMKILKFSENRINEIEASLVSLNGIEYAEFDRPQNNALRPMQETIPSCTAGRDAAHEDSRWSQRMVGLFDLGSARPTGDGIKIGQIDTGFTLHPELDIDQSYDLLNSTSTLDNSNGVDPMSGGGSHGTATASLISSRSGTNIVDDRGQVREGVTGIAPDASIVAVRAVDSFPVIAEAPFFTQTPVAEAIHHCIDVGCHVITMSIGGVVSEAVKDAISRAHQNDIIVCAAAGNCVRAVVEPAALDNVVACGGAALNANTGQPRPWVGTSIGPQITISAPAENVWVADWDSQGRSYVHPSEGTSFASPAVAAAAALWLEHHGSALDVYAQRGIRLADVFMWALKQSANTPSDWSTTINGPGVLNIPDLLALPLPQSLDETPDVGGVSGDQIVEILDLIPQVAEPVQVEGRFSRVLVWDDGEAVFGAEPYFLATFFSIDGKSASAEVNIDLVKLSSGNPQFMTTQLHSLNGAPMISTTRAGHKDNLSEVDISDGFFPPKGYLESLPHKVLTISTLDGRHRETIEPIPITVKLRANDLSLELHINGLPGWFGVHYQLNENDAYTNTAVNAAHRYIEEELGHLLREVFGHIDVMSLIEDMSGFAPRIREIERLASSRAAEQLVWFEAVWGVVDPDDTLISGTRVINVATLGEGDVPIVGRYGNSDGKRGEHGKWELRGVIRKV